MQNFTFYLPTKVHFGKGAIANLPGEIARLGGKKALLVYGGGSIRKSGLYDRITALLSEAGAAWVDLSGVEPNPKIASVREGVRLCRTHGVDFVLAAGGGSVVDCAKAIAAAYYYDGDAWDVVKARGKKYMDRALPILCVLTLAATGSELNFNSVISNPETREKLGCHHDSIRPVCSILDPTYTFTVSRFQTACGAMDIFSHAFDTYFHNERDAFVADSFGEVIMRTCVKYGRLAMDEPENYEARANLMWAGSLAINNVLDCGIRPNPWSCHSVENVISGLCDGVAHGAGLAAVTVHYLRYILNEKTAWRIARLGTGVFGIDPTLPEMEIARQAIDAVDAFITSLELPKSLSEAGVSEDALSEVIRMIPGKLEKGFWPLSDEQVLDWLKKAF